MRITGRGIGVLAGGVVLIVAGFVAHYPELAAIGTAGLLAVALAVLAGAIRPQLTVTRQVEPDHVMRGDPCTITLTIQNHRRWGTLTVIGEDQCAGQAVAVPLVRMRPGEPTTISYPVPTGKRGLVELGPLRVGRRDPFGLARVQRVFGEVSTVWVYPLLHPLAAVPSGSSRNLDGLAEKVPHGSITFDTLREYVLGDDLRHVHWRTSARIGELMVRERIDTSRPRIVVLLDDRTAGHPDANADGSASFEDACEGAASVVSAASREGLAVHLFTASGRSVPVSPGSTGFLDALAVATLHGEDGMPGGGLRGIAERARHAEAGDTLVCLTGRAGPEELGSLVGLRGTYTVIVVGVFGPAPQTPVTSSGLLMLSATDGADFASIWDGVWA
jgi:uncharacterized protein (DUF58 family)